MKNYKKNMHDNIIKWFKKTKIRCLYFFFIEIWERKKHTLNRKNKN